MLFNTIADNLIEKRFRVSVRSALGKILKRLTVGYVDRIETLPNEVCVICKTHDEYIYPPPPGFIKYIFVYGDPLESAQSVEQVVQRQGQNWFQLHQSHLQASGDYSDLYQKDVLNYEGQLNSWLTQPRPDVICIDYEDLWDREQELSEFVGFDVVLPIKRSRKQKAEPKEVNRELFERLRKLKSSYKLQYEKSMH